jgi:PAS domain S-box-containing protein
MPKFTKIKFGVRLDVALAIMPLLLAALICAGIGMWRMQGFRETTRQLALMNFEMLQHVSEMRQVTQLNVVRSKLQVANEQANAASQQEAYAKTLVKAEADAAVAERVMAGFALLALVSGGLLIWSMGRLFVKAERMVRSKERDFHSLAENTPDHIVRYDRAGRITYLNKQTAKTLGVDQSSVLGRGANALLACSGVDAYVQTVKSVLTSGEPNEVALMLPSLEGHNQVHQVCIVAERGDSGEVTGVLAIGRDITRLKQAEQELLHSRDQLRSLIAHRENNLEKEHKRIAWNLNEELGQNLVALRMRILTLKLTDDSSTQVQLQAIRELLDRSSQIARAVTTSLHPKVLDMGIAPTLEWLVDRFIQRTSLACDLHLAATEMALSERSTLLIFRAAEEALNSIARHAKTGRIVMSLIRRERECVLRVRDDGSGFDADALQQVPCNFLNIKERARVLGGALVFTRTKRGEIEFEVRIPFSEVADPVSMSVG